jgi:hypothetical protein
MKKFPANLVYGFSRQNGVIFFCGSFFRDEKASCKVGVWFFTTKKTESFLRQCFS